MSIIGQNSYVTSPNQERASSSDLLYALGQFLSPCGFRGTTYKATPNRCLKEKEIPKEGKIKKERREIMLCISMSVTNKRLLHKNNGKNIRSFSDTHLVNLHVLSLPCK